jgi:hydrogenase expression/formation protein HypE
MESILLGHGSGGKLMHQLIREHFGPAFDLNEFNDSAILKLNDNTKIAITTDSYVVSPIFFPGGNIGHIAINGTINDLSVVGAIPLFLSVGFIIEEGFPFKDLKKIVSSMSEAAKRAKVRIVTGDTKVVNKGKGDGIFINTSGVGVIPEEINLGANYIKPGDKIILSGEIGNHGIAVIAERNGLSFAPPIQSDTVALNGLISLIFDSLRELKIPLSTIKMMRDPTRGGVATTLKELANESGLTFTIYETLLPISSGVRGACELLGLDPLYVANEGIILMITSKEWASSIVDIMRDNELGKRASIIGEVSSDPKTNRMVLLRTSIGGTRIVDMLTGSQLPRIC